ncbi:ankyrin repeat and MYND domain-containing protein [Acrasis kona]|uniref:Ankyrin repeat and MYND domain-containing protein n=1 Tax=Acrasis kona TaxID=1008807 RepID=A0AAW2ZKD2_9EUKA
MVFRGVGEGEICCCCGTQSHLKRCSICKHTFYCSRICQTKDWKNHKKNCKKSKEAEFERRYIEKWLLQKNLHIDPSTENRDPVTGIRRRPVSSARYPAEYEKKSGTDYFDDDYDSELPETVFFKNVKYDTPKIEQLRSGSRKPKKQSLLLKSFAPSDLSKLVRVCFDENNWESLYDEEEEDDAFYDTNYRALQAILKVLIKPENVQSGALLQQKECILDFFDRMTLVEDIVDCDFTALFYDLVMEANKDPAQPEDWSFLTQLFIDEFVLNNEMKQNKRWHCFDYFKHMAPPSLRPAVVRSLAYILEDPDLRWMDPTFIAVTISTLAELEAVQYVPLIKKAFELNVVDLEWINYTSTLEDLGQSVDMNDELSKRYNKVELAREKYRKEMREKDGII